MVNMTAFWAAASAVFLVCELVTVALGCFFLLYPRMKKNVAKNTHATNLDMVIGQTCVVLSRIDNLAGTGSVSAGGKTWTARSEHGEVIEADALVQAVSIEGVKLIVRPV